MRHAALLVATAAAITLSAPAQTPVARTTPWYRNAVIYEIYPRSFQDSNGDGIGDLNGITSRLDYLQRLGVDAIWLAPIYPSPQVDFGYDISDYTAIDPQYGTLADFDRLMAEAKKRHIRVLMDLVLNHTSDQHPWFLESAGSRTNPKRDWYIWRDGKVPLDEAAAPGSNLAPPNNWVNRIEQSAWRFDPATRQFFYHYYANEQPDLNWRNPAVEKAMFAAARFWLDRGVAGFRLDAINTLFEDPALRDEPRIPGTNEYGEPSLSQIYQRNLPETHTILQDLRHVTDSYPNDRLLLGEIYTQSTAELAAWYGSTGSPDQAELQLPMDTNVGFLNRLDPAAFRKLLTEAEALGPANTPLLVFDNHDRPRSWDRYGDGVHNLAIAKMLAAILLLTRDSALIYQGQELGMETITPTRKEDVRDPRGLAGWPQEKGRDGERTPMQWDASTNAGFSSSSHPWLPMEASYPSKNVTVESNDPNSLWTWYVRLVHLKVSNPTLHTGQTHFLNRDADHALVWVRQQAGKPSVLVACNMSAQEITLDLGKDLQSLGIEGTASAVLASSWMDHRAESTSKLQLGAYETLAVEVR